MNESKSTALQTVQLVLYALGFAGMLAALFLVTYYPPAKGGEALAAYLFGALSAVGGVILGHKRASSRHAAPPADKAQGGFVSLRLLVLVAASFLIAFGASLLTGCAGFQQALTGYESAAKKGIEAGNDNAIAVWSVLACATPLSAALRNPQVIPALKALCLPGGNASNPADLLDGKQPITINLTLPAAPASAPK